MARMLVVILIACSVWTAVARQPVFHTLSIYNPPERPTATPSARVAALIAALSDSSKDRRRSARQELIALGPEIEPQLQYALSAEGSTLTRDLASSIRVAELAVLLSHLADSRRKTASSVSLHYQNGLITEILRD